ncbi:MAG: hypothetical protein IPM39_26845 [Chloroflexi bacterium]|nr:hypothetical protein [Chloroflexota bacterium]
MRGRKWLAVGKELRQVYSRAIRQALAEGRGADDFFWSGDEAEDGDTAVAETLYQAARRPTCTFTGRKQGRRCAMGCSGSWARNTRPVRAVNRVWPRRCWRRCGRVLVEGRLRPDPATGGPRLWTRQDGTVGASYEVVAERVIFLGGGNGANGNGNGNGHGAAEPAYEADDVPF